MDENDLQIIKLLIFNSRMSYREIAGHLDISLNAVYKRVQNLIELGVIRRFTAKINSYGGYVRSQYALLKRDIENKGDYRGKHASHCLRLLLAGTHLLRTGEPMIDVGEHREKLLAIKVKDMTFDEASGWKDELIEDFTKAFDECDLPDKPDYVWANDYLVRVRKWKYENIYHN